jgi:hypothetical protein
MKRFCKRELHAVLKEYNGLTIEEQEKQAGTSS